MRIGRTQTDRLKSTIKSKTRLQGKEDMAVRKGRLLWRQRLRKGLTLWHIRVPLCKIPLFSLHVTIHFLLWLCARCQKVPLEKPRWIWEFDDVGQDNLSNENIAYTINQMTPGFTNCRSKRRYQCDNDSCVDPSKRSNFDCYDGMLDLVQCVVHQRFLARKHLP